MRPWIYLIMMLSCLFVVAACAATKEGAPNNPPDNMADDTAEISRRIEAAIEDAKERGTQKVNIYLDEDPGLVQANDVVTLKYRAVLDTGERLASIDAARILAGKSEYIPGLGNAVLGMGRGKKQVRIAPEKAFGERSKEKEQHLSRIMSMPVKMDLDKTNYAQKFKNLPNPGERIRLNPYFESRVTSVSEDKIMVTNLARDGVTEKAQFGETLITVKDGTISLVLTPVIGAAFPLGNHQGRIISYDDKTFVVDLNHPLAGHAIDLDLEVTGIIKASAAARNHISWVDDYDTGVEKAMTEKKDMVLILYASSCPWCKKLLGQTFEDPRIRLFNDRFVFVKADSEKDADLKKIFEQDGYPMMVFTDPRGKVIKKMEGFKNVPQLLAEFESLLETAPQS